MSNSSKSSRVSRRPYTQELRSVWQNAGKCVTSRQSGSSVVAHKSARSTSGGRVARHVRSWSWESWSSSKTTIHMRRVCVLEVYFLFKCRSSPESMDTCETCVL